MVLDTAKVAKRKQLYYQYCETCHGVGGDGSNSLYPNLMRLPKVKHQLFKEIVLGGILAKYGLARYSNSLKNEDVDAVQQYLVSQEWKAYQKTKTQTGKQQ